MPVVTVRPDAVLAGAASFTVTGAANAAAATNDDSDASFFRKDSGVSGTSRITLGFSDPTVSANERVKRVRLRARAQADETDSKVDLMLGTRFAGLSYFYTGFAIRGVLGSAAPVEITGPWFTSSPDGASWDKQRVDALRSQVIEYKDGTARGYFYEFYIDVDKATKPSVTVTAPTGTTTTNSNPEVQWTYSDPDNADPQAFYEIKVFTAAQYGAVGFSPDTSSPIYGSGVVGSDEPSGPILELLLSGTYRAYVRVAKAINGQPFFSDWAFSQFVLNLTPPPTVAVDAAWDSAEGKATLTLTGGNPVGFTSQYFQLQRSDDGGVSWSFIRGGDFITPVSNVAVVVDYEAPRGLVVRYRARSIGISGENSVPSAFSSAIPQVLITNDGTWWLKVVNDPSLNRGGLKVTDGLGVTVQEPSNVFKPLGKNLPIIVSGLIGGEDGNLTITITSDNEWNSVEQTLLHQGTLLVQDPLLRQKYIRITDRSWEETYSGGRVVRDVSISYVEVEA